MSSVRLTFERGGHSPSVLQYSALFEMVSTLEQMADGTCFPQFYLSSLDPGVGKTTVFTHFIAHLIRSADHGDVSVLVCVSYKTEIRNLLRTLMQFGVSASELGVFTRDDELNALGSSDRGAARVLITTHQMIARRCCGGSFSNVTAFQYYGRPRNVRVWDEAILPGEVVRLSADQIAGLQEPCRYALPDLGNGLESLVLKLRSAQPGSSFTMPTVASLGGRPAVTVLEMMAAGRRGRDATAAEQLLHLAGRTVCIRNDSNEVATALDYRETLPDDLAPMVILDASGRVRETYALWEDREGLVRLQTAAKDYSSLQINVWHRGGGKSSFGRHGDSLLKGIAATVNTRPHEKWLVVHHLNALEGRFADDLRGLVQTPDNLSFIHWGKHHGVNDYADISNIILAGTMFLPPMIYEGRARLAANLGAEHELPDETLTAVTRGEHADLILQALSRAAVRRSEGDGCAPCTAYIIAAPASGIAKDLPRIFPGCKVGRWRPIPQQLTGKVADAVAYVERFFDNKPCGTLDFTTLRRHLQIKNISNFKKAIRKHPAFKAALEDLGVEEVVHGSGRYYNALCLKETNANPFAEDDEDDWDF
jgi:hypothetical protein